MQSIVVHDWIANHAAQTPNALALIDHFSGRRLTYADLDRRLEGISKYLLEGLTLSRGARVASLALNSTNVLELQFACARAGMIFVPLNTRLAVPELEAILDDCGVSAIFFDNDFASVAENLCFARSIPAIFMDENGQNGPFELAASIQSGETKPRSYDPDETWSLIYTSGTTGQPKGVKLSFRMALFNALNYALTTRLSPESHGLGILPMFHTSGLNLPANPCLYFGACVTITRKWDAAAVLTLLENRDNAITHVFGVPTNFLMMQQLENFPSVSLSHLTSIAVSGAPMPLYLIEEYLRKGVEIQQGFGMTETGPLVTMLNSSKVREKVGSSGVPVMHAEVKVCREDGSDVDRGEAGELAVKGPAVTLGYWNRDEETAKVFRDGWFRTGDIGYQDDEGYFYIIDRSKNMFISGGENVYPAEVEQVLNSHPDVIEAAVVGVEDDKWGEVGCALVVASRQLDNSELVAYCRQRLAGYKVPKHVLFEAELPKNATGKISRVGLNDVVVQRLSSGSIREKELVYGSDRRN